jgi:transposase
VHACPKCQSDHVINNGSPAGKPKNQGKQCGYQCTRTTQRGKPLAPKVNAVLWYLSGMSMNRIAFLLRVSAQAVLNWIRDFATEQYEKPEPTGRTIVLELDEMWHYMKEKQHPLQSWKALGHDPGELLDWECGRRDKKTLKKMVDRLARSSSPRSGCVVDSPSLSRWMCNTRLAMSTWDTCNPQASDTRSYCQGDNRIGGVDFSAVPYSTK